MRTGVIIKGDLISFIMDGKSCDSEGKKIDLPKITEQVTDRNGLCGQALRNTDSAQGHLDRKSQPGNILYGFCSMWKNRKLASNFFFLFL